MAIRYVKDFEFPSAAGYTKSSPSKVTGQMYAKGGKVDKPKAGIMVMIGVGAPKKGPMKKAEGGAISDADRRMMEQMAGDANAFTEAQQIMGQGAMSDAERRATRGAISDAEARMMRAAAAKKTKKGSPYIPGTNIKSDAEYMRELESRSGTPKYKKGGKVAKVMHEFGEGKLHSGSKKGPKVTNPKQAIAIALSEAGKSKKGYAEGGDAKKYVNIGGKRVEDTPEAKLAHVKKTFPNVTQVTPEGNPIFDKKAKGGKVSHMEWEHSKEDLAQDRKLAKKHGMSLEAWEKSAMDKKHDVQQSPKGLKKGGACYADGGMAAQSPLQRMSMAPRAMGMGKAKAVPVAPRAPMIAPPSMGQRGVGVNAKRPGGPDVGQLRAAMAKAASQAMPQNAPSMMKKGGKAK